MTGPTPTPPDQVLIDAAARHQVHLLRFSSGMIRRILDLLRAVDDRLASQIAAKLARLTVNERGEITGPVWTSDRLKALAADIKALTKLSSDTLSDALAAELLAFVEYEAAFQAGLLPKSFGIELSLTMPSPQQLYAAVMAKPLLGKHLKAIVRELDGQVRAEIMRTIREGYVLGEPTDMIVRRLAGETLGEWKRRHIEGLVRTATNHAASVARERLYAENSEMFTGVRWVSTLDHRTCFIAGTHVSTPNGPVAIETLKAGDAVIGGSGTVRSVTATAKATSKRLVKVTLSNGEVITCTEDHLFLTHYQQWCEASRLNTGQTLASLLVLRDGYR